MSKPVVELTNASIEYTSRVGLFKEFKHTALNNISLEIFEGDVFGVLGKNGSGKSTLLKVLAGIFALDDGQVSYKKGLSKALLSLGLGFNNQLTGRDNALISCMLNGLPKKIAKHKVEHIKEFSELGAFFEQPVKSYSAGMRSRLGFSAGLVLNVDLLLIDEVLSVGDQSFKQKAEKAMLDKLAGKQTVVFVSHNENQIQRLCNRCVWLEGGNLMAYGETSQVLSKYRRDCNNAA